MTDPISLVIAAGAAGGAAGKFIEVAWGSGEKWLKSFFADHEAGVIEKARTNSANFLNELAGRVEKLEERNPYDKEFFGKAFKEPSFSVLLQKAILNSAQTSRHEKHSLLAKLVSDKLKGKEESIQSLASQMACDAIAFATFNQLKILGLGAALMLVCPCLDESVIKSEQDYLRACENWVTLVITPFLDTTINRLDLLHLEALSCLIHLDFMGRELGDSLKSWKCKKFTLNPNQLFNFKLGPQIRHFWADRGLQSASLTSVGQLVGVYVFDLLANSDTDISGWDTTDEDGPVEKGQSVILRNR